MKRAPHEPCAWPIRAVRGASCWPGPQPSRSTVGRFGRGQTGAWAGVKHGWPQQTAVVVIGSRPSIGNGACNAALSGADYTRRAALTSRRAYAKQRLAATSARPRPQYSRPCLASRGCPRVRRLAHMCVSVCASHPIPSTHSHPSRSCRPLACLALS